MNTSITTLYNSMPKLLHIEGTNPKLQKNVSTFRQSLAQQITQIASNVFLVSRKEASKDSKETIHLCFEKKPWGWRIWHAIQKFFGWAPRSEYILQDNIPIIKNIIDSLDSTIIGEDDIKHTVQIIALIHAIVEHYKEKNPTESIKWNVHECLESIRNKCIQDSTIRSFADATYLFFPTIQQPETNPTRPIIIPRSSKQSPTLDSDKDTAKKPLPNDNILDQSPQPISDRSISDLDRSTSLGPQTSRSIDTPNTSYTLAKPVTPLYAPVDDSISSIHTPYQEPKIPSPPNTAATNPENVDQPTRSVVTTVPETPVTKKSNAIKAKISVYFQLPKEITYKGFLEYLTNNQSNKFKPEQLRHLEEIVTLLEKAKKELIDEKPKFNTRFGSTPQIIVKIKTILKASHLQENKPAPKLPEKVTNSQPAPTFKAPSTSVKPTASATNQQMIAPATVAGKPNASKSLGQNPPPSQPVHATVAKVATRTISQPDPTPTPKPSTAPATKQQDALKTPQSTQGSFSSTNNLAEAEAALNTPPKKYEEEKEKKTPVFGKRQGISSVKEKYDHRNLSQKAIYDGMERILRLTKGLGVYHILGDGHSIARALTAHLVLIYNSKDKTNIEFMRNIHTKAKNRDLRLDSNSIENFFKLWVALDERANKKKKDEALLNEHSNNLVAFWRKFVSALIQQKMSNDSNFRETYENIINHRISQIPSNVKIERKDYFKEFENAEGFARFQFGPTELEVLSKAIKIQIKVLNAKKIGEDPESVLPESLEPSLTTVNILVHDGNFELIHK